MALGGIKQAHLGARGGGRRGAGVWGVGWLGGGGCSIPMTVQISAGECNHSTANSAFNRDGGGGGVTGLNCHQATPLVLKPANQSSAFIVVM